MSAQNKNVAASKEVSNLFSDRLVYWLGLLFVLIGLINVTPAIPGWDELWKYLSGNDFFRVRRFPTEWFYPIIFFWMMLIVALNQSMWKGWIEKKPSFRKLGLFFDILLIVAAGAIT